MSRWSLPEDTGFCNIEYEKIREDSKYLEQKKIAQFLHIPLMNAILLYSTDGISSQLKNPDLVNKIRKQCLSKVHRFMKHLYGEDKAIKHLAKAMEIAALAREAQNIWSQRLPI